MAIRARIFLISAICAVLCFFPASAPTQTRHRITRQIDDNVRVTLRGNRHPLARPEFDTGRTAPESRMERMVLVLKPDPAQQNALEALLDAQQDPDSRFYHQWLTPERFGELFGISDTDLQQVVQWLEDKGFTVEPVPAGRNSVLFSGTAAQLESAFHAEIHVYNTRGQIHHANATDPEIPEALGEIAGGASLCTTFTLSPCTRWRYHRRRILHRNTPQAPAIIWRRPILRRSTTSGLCTTALRMAAGKP